MNNENLAADYDMMLAIEQCVPHHSGYTEPFTDDVILYLEKRDFTVDEKRLSGLIRRMRRR